MEINPQISSSFNNKEGNEQNVNTIPVTPNIQSDEQESATQGLTQEETKDPNKIAVTIADNQSPIVVLFGPPACGKTMTLIRLTRYLKNNGYLVLPVESFRPSTDIHYKKMCKGYNEMVNNNDAAKSTANISFMLVRVLDEYGKPICQILEAPGEYYYNPSKPQESFPVYVNNIKNGPNRKIWCYMVEPNWKDASDRLGYVDKINNLKTNMRPSDKAVFIFNKIDLTPYVISPGQINVKQARREIESLYPGIFARFRVRGIFGTSDNFTFVPFHTGDYSKTIDGNYSFQQGPDEYPRALWKTILNYVRG
ncbi:MAG: hypothetical protein IKX36_08640 [Prevotella sp.]|nr:hypothetical protein [Prevotella sp.]